jgi:COMPASS component SWD3
VQQRNIYRYTGHQNTSKNLIRSHFASNDNLIISGSEDGLVYIWPKESGQETTPNKSIIPSNTNGNGSGSIPAYYPPRDLRQTQSSGTSGSGVVVRPMRTLEGHGEGAVFDVRWCDGIVSAGEDGMVGVWGFDEDHEA